MNNEKMNQIIGDAYENYKTIHKHSIRTEGNRNQFAIESLEKQLIYPKKEFINKCKTDPEFSERWGLKIEERELSLEERAKWLQDTKGYDLLVGNLDHDHIREVVENESPTKLITITYNDIKTEIYES